MDAPIDVIWGNETRGLAHVEHDHPGDLDGLPSLWDGLTATREGPSRIILESPDARAVIVRNFEGEPKTWLLTYFDRRSERGPIDGAPVEGSAVRSLNRPADPNIAPMARDLNPEQLATLADEPATHDAVQHDLEYLVKANPDMTFETQTRMPDGSYSLQSRKLSDVLAELTEQERAAKEIEACVVGMEVAVSG